MPATAKSYQQDGNPEALSLRQLHAGAGVEKHDLGGARGRHGKDMERALRTADAGTRMSAAVKAGTYTARQPVDTQSP